MASPTQEETPRTASSDHVEGPASNTRHINKRRPISQLEKVATNETLADGGMNAGRSMMVREANHVAGALILDKPNGMSTKRTTVRTVSSNRKRTTTMPVATGWWRFASATFKLMGLCAGLIGFSLLISRWTGNFGSVVNPDGSFISDYKLAEVENSLKTTTKMMQVQIEAIDKKLGLETVKVRKEIAGLDEQVAVLGKKISKLDTKADGIEAKLKDMEFLSKEDISSFVNQMIKDSSLGDSQEGITWDQIRSIARDIVMKEIEKHAADGLGMVDYALASGGGRVIAHSEAYYAGKGSGWIPAVKSRVSSVHENSKKIIEPSFGEPGQCFALRGSNGFVEIKLRTTIVPEAVTLEHIAKSVAYDRSSAPKEFRISGWLDKPDADGGNHTQVHHLGEFVYNLDKSFAQTFELKTDSMENYIVDAIRLKILSNHGHPQHTCIYRLRVHGSESVPITPLAPVRQ